MEGWSVEIDSLVLANLLAQVYAKTGLNCDYKSVSFYHKKEMEPN